MKRGVGADLHRQWQARYIAISSRCIRYRRIDLRVVRGAPADLDQRPRTGSGMMAGAHKEAPPAVKARGAENIFHHDFTGGTSRYARYSNLRC